ncbi:MAG: outer membrane beta-barrel protein [Rickettsiaceae bacterium]|nr:outer membrane beta-barrel protein [Rickettsiaceae bacterium]
MKKLLLTSLLCLATMQAEAFYPSYYVRLDIAPTKAKSVTSKDTKYKSSSNLAGSVGAGVRLYEKTRAEVMITEYIWHKQKAVARDMGTFTRTGSIKSNVTSITTKGVVDFFDYGMGSLYIGAGIGLSRIKTKLMSEDTNNGSLTVIGQTSMKYKKRDNLGAVGIFGASYACDRHVTYDLSFAYQDHGKAGRHSNTSPFRFITQEVRFGARFAF